MGAYNTVVWDEDDEIVSEKLQQMSDNENFLLKNTIYPFAAGGSVSGPAADILNLKLQAGTAVCNTNASGGWAFNFPVSFPNGLLTTTVTAGDVGNPFPNPIILNIIGPQDFVSAVGGIAFFADGTPVVGLVRINYIAIGW